MFGQANPDNFPYVYDYRNPLLAEAMKVMGYVNKYNRGIAKVKTEMENNGNPSPLFDVNKLTEFRVTLLPSSKLQLATQNEELKLKNGELNDELKTKNDRSKKQTKDIPGLIVQILSEKPGLQRQEIADILNISISTLDRHIKKMTKNSETARIEHRGDRKHGGWFPKS